MQTTTLPIPRTTLAQMVGAWEDASTKIKTAYQLLEEAEANLKAAFNPDSWSFDLSRDKYNSGRYDKPEEIIKELSKDAWSAILDRLEIKKLCSIARAKEIDRQLESGEGLPEITEANILAMIDNTANQVQDFLREAVTEVFDWLRPRRSHYKTNSEFEIGERVCLSYCVEQQYNSTRLLVEYHRQANLRALDNVFHLLDGKGAVQTHYGPLCEAIDKAERGEKFETEYFECRGFSNRSLHIRFKRMDLVQKLNAIAGGMRLRGQEAA